MPLQARIARILAFRSPRTRAPAPGRVDAPGEASPRTDETCGAPSGVQVAERLPGSAGFQPAGGARSAAFASLPRAGSPRSQEAPAENLTHLQGSRRLTAPEGGVPMAESRVRAPADRARRRRHGVLGRERARGHGCGAGGAVRRARLGRSVPRVSRNRLRQRDSPRSRRRSSSPAADPPSTGSDSHRFGRLRRSPHPDRRYASAAHLRGHGAPAPPSFPSPENAARIRPVPSRVRARGGRASQAASPARRTPGAPAPRARGPRGRGLPVRPSSCPPRRRRC